MHLSSPPNATCRAHLILLSLTTRIIFGVEERPCACLICVKNEKYIAYRIFFGKTMIGIRELKDLGAEGKTG
jgi:hypothetical protein